MTTTSSTPASPPGARRPTPIRVAAGYHSAEAFLDKHPHNTPDINAVILDLELHSRQPDFDALQRIVAAGYRVIVYSHLEHHEVILACLERGALSYVVKSEGQHQLLDALHAARTDHPYMGPRMAAAICNDNTHGRPQLTDRETEVLKAWFQTENKNLVARRLHIEPTTVNTHLQRVRAKYAATGRPAPTKAALLARAVQDGLISIETL